MASFAGSARWCASYAQVCARLDALARTLPSGAARAALQRRVGQIALNVGKKHSGVPSAADGRRGRMAF